MKKQENVASIFHARLHVLSNPASSFRAFIKKPRNRKK